MPRGVRREMHENALALLGGRLSAEGGGVEVAAVRGTTVPLS
jgi:hypothetical protein